MYDIIINFKCFPGKRESFVERVKAEGILADIHAEDGCIRYDYYYSAANADELLLIEAWKTKNHQQVHLTQPHMDRLRGFKDDYISETEFFEIEYK